MPHQLQQHCVVCVHLLRGCSLTHTVSGTSCQPTRFPSKLARHKRCPAQAHASLVVLTSECGRPLLLPLPLPLPHSAAGAQGVPDTVVWHPGGLGVPGLEVEPRYFAQIGAGQLARPKT